MTTIHIPPAALEAGARAILKTWCVSPWEMASEQDRLNSFDEARAAFVEMVKAWPGMKLIPYWEHMTHKRRVEMILPLMENSDDKA